MRTLEALGVRQHHVSHLRPAPHYKLIIRREEGENEYLRGYTYRMASNGPMSHMGPMCLIDGNPGEADLELAATVVARYSQGREAGAVTLEIRQPGGTGRVVTVVPMAPEALPAGWLV